jgi:hypothetical protein
MISAVPAACHHELRGPPQMAFRAAEATNGGAICAYAAGRAPDEPAQGGLRETSWAAGGAFSNAERPGRRCPRACRRALRSRASLRSRRCDHGMRRRRRVMVRRGEITDVAWERTAPLLPDGGRPGGRWREHREAVNAILWKLRTAERPGTTCPKGTAPAGRPAIRSLRPLAARRHLGWASGPRPDQERCGRGGREGGERGLERGSSGAPARRRGTQVAQQPGGRKQGPRAPRTTRRSGGAGAG